MIKKTISLFVLTGLVALTSFATSVDARTSRPTTALGNGSSSFATSTIFSGSLVGTIEVGDMSVMITKDTRIFVRDRGLVENAPRLYRNTLHVTGVRYKDGRLKATMIFVGPEVTRGRSSDAGKLPANAAR